MFVSTEMMRLALDVERVAQLEGLGYGRVVASSGVPLVYIGISRDFAMALARSLAITTCLSFPGAVDVVLDQLTRVGPMAKQVRLVARVLGTNMHYGEIDDAGVHVDDLQTVARACVDQPWSGEGDFAAWLGLGYEGCDW